MSRFRRTCFGMTNCDLREHRSYRAPVTAKRQCNRMAMAKEAKLHQTDSPAVIDLLGSDDDDAPMVEQGLTASCVLEAEDFDEHHPPPRSMRYRKRDTMELDKELEVCDVWLGASSPMLAYVSRCPVSMLVGIYLNRIELGDRCFIIPFRILEIMCRDYITCIQKKEVSVQST